MNEHSFFMHRGRQMLLVNILIIVAVLTSSYVALPQQQQQGQSPVLVINAPAQVQLGDQIEIQLIVEHARESACDAIVIGSHGMGAVTSILLGSIASKVVHLSDKPVTIVK